MRKGVSGRKALWFICIFSVFILLFTGCGKKQEDLKDKVDAFNASIGESSGEDLEKNKGIVVGSVNMGMTGEWFSEVMNGIRNASNDLNVTVEMLDSANDTVKEAQNIDALLKKGIDVLVISPLNSTESAKSLQKVKDAGIPIITWNTTVNMDVTAYVGVDSEALGGNTGDYLTEYIKTNNLSHVKLIVLKNSTYDVGIARCEGFLASIQDLVNQDIIEIVAQEDAELIEQGEEVTTKLLKKYPDADMIWAWNQTSLLGCIDAVKKSGKKDIIIMGTDMSMDLAKDMLGNEVNLQAITTQLPYNMGYKAVVNAVDAVNGKEIDKKILIPLSTYRKSATDEINRYIETHKDLVQD